MTKFIAISVLYGGSGKAWSDSVLAVRAILVGGEDHSSPEWQVEPGADRLVRFADAKSLVQRGGRVFSEQRATEVISEWLTEWRSEYPLIVFFSDYEEDLLRQMFSRCDRVALPRDTVSIDTLIRAYFAIRGERYPSILGGPSVQGSAHAVAAYAEDLLRKLGGGA